MIWLGKSIKGLRLGNTRLRLEEGSTWCEMYELNFTFGNIPTYFISCGVATQRGPEPPHS